MPRSDKSLSIYDPHAPRYNRRTGKNLICQYCKNEFYVSGWRLKKNPKYCSSLHYWLNKHDIPWNKGTKGLVQPNKTSFKSNGMTFEGTMSEYKSLHYWVRKVLGKPLICENCGYSNNEPKKLHWANKSHQYLKEKFDWLALCVKCHFEYDKKYRY